MKERSGFKVMAKLIVLVKSLTLFMILAITMGLLGHLCAAFITVFGGCAVLNILGIDTGIATGTIFICLSLFALFRGLLRYGEQGCNHYIAFKLLAIIRDKVFVALRRLCPAKLEGRGKGDLINLITSDIELLEVFYAHTISPTVIAVLFSAIFCFIIGSIHPALGIIALIAYLTVGLAVPLISSKLSGDSGMQFRAGSGRLGSFVLDSLRGLSETLQYRQGEKRIEDMQKRGEELSQIEKEMKRRAGFNIAFTDAIILLFDLAMLFASVGLNLKGSVEFSGVLMATLCLMSSFGPVIALANLGTTLQSTFAAGNRVLDILEEEPAVEELSGKESFEFKGAEAKNVSFSYGDEEVIEDFSLDVPENSIVGIVGKSGSGKSTLLKLFMRFWEANKGELRLSGRRIDDINTSDLRDSEAYMTQETELFRDSIRNNLKIAKLDATDEELIAACKKASVHDFIMSLPKGYDTELGELGETISGGERQRLGLARAFLHDAPFMLLDEPTSNLDSLNEAVILRSLKEEGRDRTVLIVSHRASTLRIADKEVKMENGRMS